jgi:outer membrane biosynthesis protein TonB
MGWLLRQIWPWTLLAFLAGAAITWLVLARSQASTRAEESPAKAREQELVGAAAGPSRTTLVEPFDQDLHAPPPAEKQPHPLPQPEAKQKAPKPPKPKARQEPRAAPQAPKPKARQEAPEAAPAFDNHALATQEPSATQERAVRPVFSRRMEERPVGEATLFPEPQAVAVEPHDEVAPAGRFGAGSADAVPHQGPPDGFTIKGNTQSMLFHTPDSPYYGRTKPQVWFRTEADAERAGFTKYARKPRKSADPRG